MTRDPGEVLQTPVTRCNMNVFKWRMDYALILPLDRELHSICVTLMLKERSNEAPDETTVSTMGLLLSSPMSMYTASEMSESEL